MVEKLRFYRNGAHGYKVYIGFYRYNGKLKFTLNGLTFRKND